MDQWIGVGRGGHYSKSHRRSTVLRKASLNKKKGAFRGQATGPGILLMAGHDSRQHRGRVSGEKGRWEMGSEM